ncbi:hypothetical protein SAMN05216298_4290 [Glycomyces sambucus]|uniref:DUF4232 domain-containing protein n=1 Tax=Glycomyces sambucus TaxID=380244 RepID=A0A1G9KXC7_9ACTN|nr:hypothetical protein [Glycomyces sambucus]SDL54163.1 hypothetical protein SAMN05216298_4290 [Glycomyces sambucus]
MRWIRIAVIGAFLLAAATAAVGGSLAGGDRGGSEPTASEPTVTTPSAPPDLTATAEIRRSFMAPGIVAIAVTNHGEAPVQIGGVELRSESFAPLGVQEFDAHVPPSTNPRDLLTSYGEARCPDGVDSTAAPAAVVLDVTTEDGEAHQITLDLPFPNGTLDRLLHEACAAQAVAAATAIELGDLSTAADGTLEGDLVLRPLDGAAIGATEVRGSVLFTVAFPPLAAGPVAGAAGEEIAVPLVFDAFRCEGHAVGDAKQPFGFTVWITIDGADPIATPLPVPDPQREDLWAMLDARCDHDG